MDLIDASIRIIENQGIVAFLLIMTIIQSYETKRALLKKNCELTAFIMECLKSELMEDQDDSDRSKYTAAKLFDKQQNDTKSL
jgi:hypothetical protein